MSPPSKWAIDCAEKIYPAKDVARDALSQLIQNAIDGACEEKLEELRQRVARLRYALDEATDVGVYPQSVTTEGGATADYAERTMFMVGWNAHSTAALKAAIKIVHPGDWSDETTPAQETP